jgi:putative addiction module component (TIGR02574 family)
MEPTDLQHRHSVRFELALAYNRLMAREFAEIMQDALALPEEARAALAGSLLDSLDTEGDADVEAAWLAEIQRRSGDLNAGTVFPIGWREVDARIESALKRAR